MRVRDTPDGLVSELRPARPGATIVIAVPLTRPDQLVNDLGLALPSLAVVQLVQRAEQELALCLWDRVNAIENTGDLQSAGRILHCASSSSYAP